MNLPFTYLGLLVGEILEKINHDKLSLARYGKEDTYLLLGESA